MFHLESYNSKEELILLLSNPSNLLFHLYNGKYQTSPIGLDILQEIFPSLPVSVFPEQSEDDQGECFTFKPKFFRFGKRMKELDFLIE
jgi:hypothetical protein